MSTPEKASLRDVVVAEYDDIRVKATMYGQDEDQNTPFMIAHLAGLFASLGAAGAADIAPDQHLAAHAVLLAAVARLHDEGVLSSETTSIVVALVAS